jgi:hypothetical protein
VEFEGESDDLLEGKAALPRLQSDQVVDSLHLLEERRPREKQEGRAEEEQQLGVFPVSEQMIHQTQPVILRQHIGEQGLQKGPSIDLGRKSIRSQVS